MASVRPEQLQVTVSRKTKGLSCCHGDLDQDVVSKRTHLALQLTVVYIYILLCIPAFINEPYFLATQFRGGGGGGG